MKKPIIGLTPSHNTENDDISMRPTYIRALEAAGAIPFILPLELEQEDLKTLSNLCQGFLFTGGAEKKPIKTAAPYQSNVIKWNWLCFLSLWSRKNQYWESAGGHKS